MKKNFSLMRDESGAITVMTVIMMAAFVGLLALVVDLGHLHVTQNELRNAADAAALAGARRLMPMEAPLVGSAEPPWPMEVPPPCGAAVQAAADTAILNKANLKNITISKDPQEILTGFWDFKPVGIYAGTFTENPPTSCNANTNAVKVTARMRGDLSQGSVIMTFARIFGYNTVNPSATAVAALGYLQTLPKNSNGGFLGADYDFMKRAEDNWIAGNKDQIYYIVLGPAGGQTGYQYADNGGWAVPAGTTSPNTTINNTIANGTQADISIGDGVDLKNGQFADSVMKLQDAVIAANHALDFNILGVYADALGASVGDAWNDKSTRVDGFWQVELTNVWKSQEFKHDPNVQAMTTLMDYVNAQKKLVGVIAFKMMGPYASTGPGGAGLPSNTYTLLPKLVQ